MTIRAHTHSPIRLDLFREKVATARRQTGRLQRELADALGIDAHVLSRKLHGARQTFPTHSEVKKIIKTLAGWDAITKQAEAIELLSFVGLRAESFSEQEWTEAPLNRLEPAAPTSTDSVAGLPEGQATPMSHFPIPASSTSLIGRDYHVHMLLDRLRNASVRLLTLLGAGGVGKTRLALEVARAARHDFADGVFFVSLATIRDAALVPSTIVQALHLSEPAVGSGPGMQGVSSHEDVLKRFLREKEVLLVLDNVEQIPDIASFISDLLSTAEVLKVMVTSRAVLHMYGEHEFDVPPLDVCAPDSVYDADSASQFPAIRLFVERAQALNPAFQITASNAATIVHICARLDGLPLAIELAAARTKLFSLSSILQRLAGVAEGKGGSLAFLRSTAHDVLSRHRTLYDTLHWSYDLLDVRQQRLFRRLGIFLGGWTVEAALPICMAEGQTAWPVAEEGRQADQSATGTFNQPLGDDMLRSDVLEQMESLMDHSLIRLHSAVILSSVSQGPEKNEGEGSLPSAADPSLSLRMTNERITNERMTNEWMALNERMSLEGPLHEENVELRFHLLETIREFALEQLEACGEREALQRRHAAYYLALAERVEPILHGHEQSLAVSMLTREQDNLRAALSWAIEQNEAAIAQRICGALGKFWEARTQFEEALRWIDAALHMSQETTTAIRAKLLMVASRMALWEVACERSRELAKAALALYEEVGDIAGKTEAMFQIGDTWHMQGEYIPATSYLEECLPLLREQENWRTYAFALSRLGAMSLLQGNFPQAWTYLSEAVTLQREYSEPGLLNVTLVYLGVLAFIQGDLIQGAAYLRDGLLLAQDTGNRYMLAIDLTAFGCLLGTTHGPSYAARICSAAEALFESLNTALPAAYRPLYEAYLGSSKSQVDSTTWEIWWAEGKALSQEDIHTLVLSASEVD